MRRLLALVPALAIAACQLDWTERPDPADAGTTPTKDADPDVAATDASSPDVVTPDGGTDCAALIQQVDNAKKNARACQLAVGQCQSTVKDQCDCDVVVALGGSAATAAFQQAVANLKAHPECVTGCTAACTGTSNKNCLSSVDGTYCYQQ